MLRNGEEVVWLECLLCCLHTLPSALIFKEKFSVKFSTVKMHSVEEQGTNVPAFLAKLWKIVEDPETNDLICWSSVCNKVTNVAVIEPCIREANIYLLFSSYRVSEKL